MTGNLDGWTRVATTGDMPPPGEVVGVQAGSELVLLANVEGELLAVSDVCTHEYVLLHDGWLEDDLIECPSHGSQFDLRTGKVLSLPATKPIPVYDIRFEGEDVYVRPKETPEQ